MCQKPANVVWKKDNSREWRTLLAQSLSVSFSPSAQFACFLSQVSLGALLLTFSSQNKHTHTHAHTHARTHTHTHSRTHARTHTHTHAHAPFFPVALAWQHDFAIARFHDGSFVERLTHDPLPSKATHVSWAEVCCRTGSTHVSVHKDSLGVTTLLPLPLPFPSLPPPNTHIHNCVCCTSLRAPPLQNERAFLLFHTDCTISLWCVIVHRTAS